MYVTDFLVLKVSNAHNAHNIQIFFSSVTHALFGVWTYSNAYNIFQGKDLINVVLVLIIVLFENFVN